MSLHQSRAAHPAAHVSPAGQQVEHRASIGPSTLLTARDVFTHGRQADPLAAGQLPRCGAAADRLRAAGAGGRYRLKISIAGGFHGLTDVHRGDIVELDPASAARYLAAGYIERRLSGEVGRPYVPEK
jgi:hypothetical protein